MIVAGIGCRRSCAAEDIVAAVRHAAWLAGRQPDLLAAPCFKAGEPGLRPAAAALALRLVLVARDRLAAVQPLCATRSGAAAAATGLASVAEAAALAASLAGCGGAPLLLLARIAHGGATCALAGSGPA